MLLSRIMQILPDWFHWNLADDCAKGKLWFLGVDPGKGAEPRIWNFRHCCALAEVCTLPTVVLFASLCVFCGLGSKIVQFFLAAIQFEIGHVPLTKEPLVHHFHHILFYLLWTHSKQTQQSLALQYNGDLIFCSDVDLLLPEVEKNKTIAHLLHKYFTLTWGCNKTPPVQIQLHRLIRPLN